MTRYVAKRVARRDASGEPPVYVFEDVEFALPPRMTAGFVEALDENNMTGACRMLLGDAGWEQFNALGADLDDMIELLAATPDMYGTSMGEAVASSSSSENTGTPSRPTSDASTG